MCFVPIISISTAFIEFIIVIFILFYFKKTLYKNTLLIFISLLGLYQFSEYMLCTSLNPFLWAKIGIIVYTFLPVLGLKMVLEVLNIYETKSIINNLKIFFLPIMFSIIALIKNNFITSTFCEKYFILVNRVFSNNYSYFFDIIYSLYYFGTISIIFYLLIKSYRDDKQTKKNKKIILYLVFAFIIGLLPAIILLFISPSLGYKFPSVYCHFSLLTTFCLIRIFYLEKSI